MLKDVSLNKLFFLFIAFTYDKIIKKNGNLSVCIKTLFSYKDI